MKFKTTEREVMKGFDKVISIGYCNAQYLLNYESPIAYTCGSEGWRSDVYNMGKGIAIVTGYAPFGNIKPDYDIIRAFDIEAERLVHERALQHEDMKKALRELQKRFLKDVCGNENDA